MAETRKQAENAFDFFLEAYAPKYDKATACLAKDRDALLTFYDFPAEHWKHIRTTNPIESFQDRVSPVGGAVHRIQLQGRMPLGQ